MVSRLNDTHEYNFDTELWSTVEVTQFILIVYVVFLVAPYFACGIFIYILYDVCFRQVVRYLPLDHAHRGVRRETRSLCSG
jgi:hypothetical protein